jgi:hypothetical protein
LSGSVFNSPTSVAVDPSENLFVAEYNNNRVLKFTYQGSTSASAVYGQNGSYTTSTHGTSAIALNTPNGVAATASGVYIVDTGNNRMLFFSGSSTTATTGASTAYSRTVSMTAWQLAPAHSLCRKA